jgi:hypothetical protein
MSNLRLWTPLTLALALGCSVTEVPPPPDTISINACDERADCGGGRCDRGMCVAQNGVATALFLEVTPPASAKNVASMPLYSRLAALDPRGSALEVEVSPLVRVSVTVSASPALTCELSFVGKTPGTTVLGAHNRSIPVAASFEPRERREFPGLATATYAGSVDIQGWEWTGPVGAEPPPRPAMLSFGINLPAGYYDVYFDPPRATEGACEIPPLLVRDVTTTNRDPEPHPLDLSVELPQPTPLDVTVRWPRSGNSLRGWVLEVLDPVSARRISTRTVLGDPAVAGETASYTARVHYTPVHANFDGLIAPDPALEGREIVRLSPPVMADDTVSLIEQVAAPAIVVSLEGHIFPGNLVIEQRSVLPAPVIVQSHVNAYGEPSPLAADVTVVATSIDNIDPGVLTSFVRQVRAEADGQLDLKLLPGEYEVRAVPSDSSTRGTTVTTWSIDGEKSFQGGRIIELLSAPRFRGTASLPGSGGGASGASVHLVPSAPESLPSALSATLSGAPLVPRGAVELLGDEGRFDLAVDPGVFDLSVRPEARSRFGWYVAAGLELTGAEDDELPQVAAAPLPVAYRGKVWLGGSVVGTPIGGALIRAFAYRATDGQFTNDPGQASTLVQIAETRADDDGRYELLIPASLN